MADELDDEFEVITLVDEDGEEKDFVMLSVVELPEGQFAVLTPAEAFLAEEEAEDGLELYVFTYSEDENGDVDFNPVEDEALIDRVIEIVDQQLGGEE